MSGDRDLFKTLNTGTDKGGYPDTHTRLVGRSWGSAFPTGTVFDNRNLPTWLFGQPEIRCDNEGWGQWERKALQAKSKDSHDINRHFRYGNWAVHLNGGPQASEESWAAVSFAVNEMPVKDIKSIAYDWYAAYNGSAHILDVGPNLVFSAYDPTDHSHRVDFNTYAVDNAIFMDDGLVNRPVEAGWYRFIMTDTDASERVYYYANNDGDHTPCVTDGADYYWSQYVVDTVLKDWVVYRIQISFGYLGATRSAGDVWIDAPKINGYQVKWEPTPAEIVEIDKRDAGYFGKPSLDCYGHGRANWTRGGSRAALLEKGHTGWLANLVGGVMSGTWYDFGRILIPVKEMHVPDFKTALWNYYMLATQTMGVNIVIRVHDPFDYDRRAEISQQANIAGLIKTAGWNAHELDPSVSQFYWYGENCTGTNLTEGSGQYYSWNQFVADELFNTWTIYNISLEYGWEASGTFQDVWIADVKFNGVPIALGPDTGTHRKTIVTTQTLVGGASSAGDVVCSSITTGVTWDFNFGGTGYITKAILDIATTSLTPLMTLYIYSSAPTCELRDNVANTGPVAADVPYLIGQIDFPAMTSKGTGHSYTIATPGTSGNLPIAFDSPILYCVLVDGTGSTLGNVVGTITLTADMDDN